MVHILLVGAAIVCIVLTGLLLLGIAMVLVVLGGGGNPFQ